MSVEDRLSVLAENDMIIKKVLTNLNDIALEHSQEIAELKRRVEELEDLWVNAKQDDKE